MTDDHRTVYTITNGDSLATVSSTGSITALIEGSNAQVTVSVTWPGYWAATDLVASKTIQLVKFTELTISMNPHPG